MPHIPQKNSWGLGGVIEPKTRAFVEESGEWNFGGYYDYNEKDVIKYDLDVIYLRYLIPHWGTFLVDCMRRMYYKFFTENGKKCKVAVIGINLESKPFYDIRDQCYSFLQSLGVERKDFIVINQPAKFRKVFVPEVGYEYKQFYYREFLIPYQISSEYFCKQMTKTYPERIYLSRTKFKGKKETGEKQIEKFFSKNGFCIIYPEKLSIGEQVRLFANAKIIASVEGTIAHNILFAQPGVRQIIIRKQSELNIRQVLFDEAKQIKIQYIDCYKEFIKGFPVDHDNGPFLLLFNRQIREFAADNEMRYSSLYTLKNGFAIIYYLVKCAKYTIVNALKDMKCKFSVRT